MGMKKRLRSSHVTLRHPLLVPALIIVCNHSALIPTLWVPSGPLPSLLFDVRQSRGTGPARLCRGARGLPLWPPVLQGLLACLLVLEDAVSTGTVRGDFVPIRCLQIGLLHRWIQDVSRRRGSH